MTISPTTIQRIVIVGSELVILEFLGTSRIEEKHRRSAKKPAMQIVILDIMMPDKQTQRRPFVSV